MLSDAFLTLGNGNLNQRLNWMSKNLSILRFLGLSKLDIAVYLGRGWDLVIPEL